MPKRIHVSVEMGARDALCGIYALTSDRVTDYWPAANCERCLAKLLTDGVVTPIVSHEEYLELLKRSGV